MAEDADQAGDDTPPLFAENLLELDQVLPLVDQ
jgi:hypothetical protein